MFYIAFRTTEGLEYFGGYESLEDGTGALSTLTVADVESAIGFNSHLEAEFTLLRISEFLPPTEFGIIEI